MTRIATARSLRLAHDKFDADDAWAILASPSCRILAERMAVRGDRRMRLVTIRAPGRVIHGREDQVLPPVGGRDVATSIPSVELSIIEGMGHDLPAAVDPVAIEAIDCLSRHAAPKP